jgi:hypothetical protein
VERWHTSRSIKGLRGYTIRAVDGYIGKLYSFLFDDLEWAIRYLVVDTGDWLPGRQVLLPPIAIDKVDAESQSLAVSLTEAQVENSPPLDADAPVSRRIETELHEYYGWVPYWRTGVPAAGSGPVVAAAVLAAEGEDAREESAADPHLRSTREVVGYHIGARDGEIGHVDDFLAEEDRWIIRHLVVDTGNWLPGKRVLVLPTWIEKVNWAERIVSVGLKRETTEKSPEFRLLT